MAFSPGPRLASLVAKGARQQLLFGSAPVWRLRNRLAGGRRPAVAPGSALHAEAQRVLSDLDREGIALSSLEALTGDPALLGRLQAFAAQLEHDQAELLGQRRALLAQLTGTPSGGLACGGSSAPAGATSTLPPPAADPVVMAKPFVVELLDRRRPPIEPDGLLAEVALHEQLRGVANAYFGLRARVADLNIWRSLRSSAPPASSQMWHRDIREDRYVLKMFIYLEDVEEGGGPFTYLRGSHPKGPGRRLRLPGQSRELAPRAPDGAPERAGAGERVLAATGRAGTLVFADTLGYHRGGFAVRTDRLLLQCLYASPAADRHRMLGVPDGVDAAQFAPDLAYDAGRG